VWFFPLGAAAVSGAFTATLATQWIRARRAHVLAWSIALPMFRHRLTRWHRHTGRSVRGALPHLLPGAILNVPVLALGTIYLLGPRLVGHLATILVCVACVAAAGFLVVAGGAAWSAARLARSGEERVRRLAVANGLIAAGTVVVAVGSTFAFHGRGLPFAIGLLLAVCLMFWGFLRARPRRALRTS
jgi:hypothetical protein